MKTLAIIGASYLQLPLVNKAKEMGLRTICFAWEEGAICKDIADKFYPISIIEKEEILSVCQKEKIDGICTIASDVAVLTVNYVAERMGLIGNEDKYSGMVTNKYLMRQCFSENAIPSPKFTHVNENSAYDISDFTFPLIVKPTDRSGSRGVEKVLCEEELPKAIARAVSESFAKEAIIEEFVEGREVSVETISYNGKHYVLQITDKVTTGEPYFVELEHHQPSTLPENVQNEIRTIVPKALDALHIANGASHSEIKITAENKLRFVEIGARMGGDFIGSDLVRLSTGYDFLKAVIEVALGTFTEPILTEQHCSGVYFLSKETEYIKEYIENKDKYPQIVQAEITDSELHNIECSANRSGYFIYQGEKKYMIPRLEDLIWDSNFFNKKIGRVFLDTIEECQLLNYLEQDNVKKFDLIYIYSPNILPAFSAYLVEVKVVYEGKVTCDNVSVEECNCSKYNDKIITPELERLAWKSAVYSRFKVDSKFGEQYKRLYSSWMKKSLSGVIADCVFCHKTNSEVDGMVTVRKKDNVGEIGLIAVDSKIRTKGIGTALVNSVKLWLQQQDINQLEVTTQQANRQACNFFEKQGLTQQTVTYIYHYWL